MAIDLPAGEHDVVLRYGMGTAPRRLGLARSAVTLVAMGALSTASLRRRSEGPSIPPNL